MVSTAFTELVGCDLPVQQAPMGSISTVELAVAVSDAGGLGSVSAWGMPPEAVAELAGEASARAGGPLAVNLVTDQLDLEAVAAAAERARVVDVFWAQPRADVVATAHAADALVCWQVGSLAEARAAVDAGCDLLAVQGVEAGGHVRGRTALLPLLAQVLDVVDVPVLAAGGIAHPRSVAAVLAAGAAGVRAGTRFAATAESGAHPLYKQALVDAGEASTVVTGAFAVCPMCATSPRARVLVSAVEALETAVGAEVGRTVFGGREVPLPRGHGAAPTRATTGQVEAMALYAGEGVGAVRDLPSAADALRHLCSSLA